jgi:hypothetical protein
LTPFLKIRSDLPVGQNPVVLSADWLLLRAPGDCRILAATIPVVKGAQRGLSMTAGDDATANNKNQG